MIRELFTKLSGVLERNTHSIRRKCDAPVRISFEPVKTTGNLHTTIEGLSISGEAADVSKTGIAFIVGAIRVKEFYLVGQDRKLLVEVDLPGRKVKMKVIGRRYEKVGIHVSSERYLIGAEIVEMEESHRQAYERFLRYGSNKNRSTSPGWEMGVD